MALNRVWIPSPNYSSRGGTKVRLVVLHTAEGSRTYQSLGSYFGSSSSGVSSHVGIDDTPGTVGEYVKPDQKAWTQGNANPYSVAAETCAFAKWTTAEWNTHPQMLANTAAWVAEECARFGIPVRALTASQAQGGQAGVCQHVDLGAAGGGHWDCGSGFPMADVIAMASTGAIAPPQPQPPQPEEDDDDMRLAQSFVFNGWLHVFYITKSHGELWHKFSNDQGGTWQSETLMGPGNQREGYVQTPTLVEVQTPMADDYVANVTVFDEKNSVWICRQTKGSSVWDRRKL